MSKLHELVLLYLVLAFFTAGSIMRHLQASAPTLARQDYREDLGIAILLGLLPPAWLAAPFLTGFWKHGWGFNCMYQAREPTRQRRFPD